MPSAESRPRQAGAGANAAAQWRWELAQWKIPEHILAAAAESPYGLPVGMFRAESVAADTPSRRQAAEALPPGGAVLDVGCGGGRASLALVPPAGELTGVDSAEEMLAEYARGAAERGVGHREVLGAWPAVAASAGNADVVVCHHVLYNIADLVPFAQALTAAARARVVVELTAAHPWAATNDLWRRFHGLERPAGPTAGVAIQALREAGLAVSAERWSRPPRVVEPELAVTALRRRLCLTADRDPEIAAVLLANPPGEQEVVTLWWDTPARRSG